MVSCLMRGVCSNEELCCKCVSFTSWRRPPHSWRRVLSSARIWCEGSYCSVPEQEQVCSNSVVAIDYLIMFCLTRVCPCTWSNSTISCVSGHFYLSLSCAVAVEWVFLHLKMETRELQCRPDPWACRDAGSFAVSWAIFMKMRESLDGSNVGFWCSGQTRGISSSISCTSALLEGELGLPVLIKGNLCCCGNDLTSSYEMQVKSTVIYWGPSGQFFFLHVFCKTKLE